MAMTWWQKWLGRPARGTGRARFATFRPGVERLEDIITPAVSINSLNFAPAGPINEGGSSTLQGTYTATNVVGSVQLTISSSVPFVSGTGTATTLTLTLPSNGSTFSQPLTFIDNGPSGAPVSVTATITDTGPTQLSSGADAGGYRALSVPFIRGVNLANSLAVNGPNSGVQTAIPGPSTGGNNQNGQISLQGNTFTLYGQNVGTQIGVNENGLVTFNGLAPSTADVNGSLSGLANTLGAVAPLWTNLVLSPTGRVTFRFVDLDGSTAGSLADYLVIEWSNVLHVTPGGTSPSTGTFQAFLQLNTATNVNGDIIFNYVDTDFGDTNSNAGADATVGTKGLNSTGSFLTDLAVNAGAGAPIINNFATGHAVRFTSNAVTIPLGFGANDGFGYKAFRMPFESKVDLVSGTANGQATNVILTGTFDNSSGFQSGPQSLQSSITIGTTPVVSNNTFNFYGVNYTNIVVSKNGFLTMAASPSPNNALNGSMSSAQAPVQATIAPLWDDWNGFAGAGAQILGRFLDFDGDGTPEFLVVNWKGVNNGGASATSTANRATFQAILELNTGTDAGGIYFNYTDTDVGDGAFNSGASATVGVKDVNPVGNNFLDISVSGSTDLDSGRALGVFPTGSAARTATIQVNNVAPTLSANPGDNLTLNEGGTFTRTIRITDPGRRDTFTGTVDFGDGSGVQNINMLPGGTTALPLNHVYALPGSYTVTVNLTDKDAGAATPLTFTVTVNNVAPAVAVAPGQGVRPGQTLVLNGQNGRAFLATFTDPGFTPSFGSLQQTFTTTVDWGDGTVENVPPNTPNVTQTVTNGSAGVPTTGTIAGSHQYAGQGNFAITVTVRDAFGGVTTQTILVGVGSTNVLAVGAGEGGFPVVTIFDSRLMVQTGQITAYDRFFGGGVRVAVGDISGDGLADVVTAPGPGGGPHIKVFNGSTLQTIRSFFAYGPAFTGGVFVAAGDVTGDGRADIVTGAGDGGGPHVKVFDGVTGAEVRSFFAFNAGFTGGVRVAAADVDGDGAADIVCAAGPGGGPHVIVFSGATGAILRSFFAYDINARFGVYVAAADINGDALADIVTGPGTGGPPILRVFNGVTGRRIIDAFAFPPGVPGEDIFSGNNIWKSGLRVGVTDLNLDGTIDLIAAAGPGKAPAVRVFDFATFTPQLEFLAFDPSFLGGVYVSGN